MNNSEMVLTMRKDIDENRFELRAKVRKLRDTLNEMLEEIDKNDVIGNRSCIAPQASEIDRIAGHIGNTELVIRMIEGR